MCTFTYKYMQMHTRKYVNVATQALEWNEQIEVFIISKRKSDEEWMNEDRGKWARAQVQLGRRDCNRTQPTLQYLQSPYPLPDVHRY